MMDNQQMLIPLKHVNPFLQETLFVFVFFSYSSEDMV